MNKNYPINITQEMIIEEDSYLKINLDINIDRKNPPNMAKIKTALENAVAKLIEIYS